MCKPILSNRKNESKTGDEDKEGTKLAIDRGGSMKLSLLLTEQAAAAAAKEGGCGCAAGQDLAQQIVELLQAASARRRPRRRPAPASPYRGRR